MIDVMGLLVDFYLDLEDFRDFVASYRLGRHRPDDPPGKMSAYELQRKDIQFQRTIEQFWSFPFEQNSFRFTCGCVPRNIAPYSPADTILDL